MPPGLALLKHDHFKYDTLDLNRYLCWAELPDEFKRVRHEIGPTMLDRASKLDPKMFTVPAQAR